MANFYMKFCPNDHVVYAEGGMPTQKYCTTCGEELISKCPSCNSDIPNYFESRKYFTNNTPVNFPRKNDFCIQCGQPYPWAKQFISGLDHSGIWELMHPTITEICKSRFESGHYADSVEAAFKEINAIVKSAHYKKTGKEEDGKSLMFKAFSSENPSILLSKLDMVTGRNIQEGYMYLFAGSIQAIRNPNAHNNLKISKELSIHYLFIASLLFKMLDKGIIQEKNITT
ncbi:hypothetical protein BerOc1_00347 [Pseudodesulfovibrio hydrargyri]|uniref:Conserved hypothetical protein CHP02391 domain-containing protein n=1 Tax=Pseudodesulfovibrio hydrargyri TaxID=2125990 RepID=A0A1J5N8C9_9BACT|nr:TIGR02391 family protein [Pseudodesulfovibrio hydrargyri]OIQ51883.1 hypothetical protein BerOc1_00347 [Pseudodesulfovibrio hydrargyri]